MLRVGHAFSLSKRAELAAMFQPASEQASRRSRGSFFGFVPEGTPRRSQRNLLGAWKPAKGELRSPDKLKHVPRNLTAVWLNAGKRFKRLRVCSVCTARRQYVTSFHSGRKPRALSRLVPVLNSPLNRFLN